MYEGGISKMYWSVSDTAEYGDYTRGPRIVNDATQGGDEADPRRDHRTARSPREWMAEYDAGLPNYKRYYQENTEHPIEQTGAQLRPLMSWISRETT